MNTNNIYKIPRIPTLPENHSVAKITVCRLDIANAKVTMRHAVGTTPHISYAHKNTEAPILFGLCDKEAKSLKLLMTAIPSKNSLQSPDHQLSKDEALASLFLVKHAMRGLTWWTIDIEAKVDHQDKQKISLIIPANTVKKHQAEFDLCSTSSQSLTRYQFDNDEAIYIIDHFEDKTHPIILSIHDNNADFPSKAPLHYAAQKLTYNEQKALYGKSL